MAKKKISTVRYLSFFITRAFLIAVLLMMSFSCLILIGYFGDYYLNEKKGNNSPLYGAYIIVSKSMVPTINVNDAIIIKRIDNDNYKIGDVITFNSSIPENEEVAVTHRIIDKTENKKNSSLYTTKGDHNVAKDDALVKTEDIYGKVLFKIPCVGYIQGFFSKPKNFLLTLLIPTFLFIIYELGRIYKMLYRKRKS